MNEIFGHKILAEAVLETFEDFFLPVADDLREPDAAVHHRDEEGALVQSGRLGVLHHVGIGMRGGEFQTFAIRLARRRSILSRPQNFRQHGGGGL